MGWRRVSSRIQTAERRVERGDPRAGKAGGSRRGGSVKPKGGLPSLHLRGEARRGGRAVGAGRGGSCARRRPTGPRPGRGRGAYITCAAPPHARGRCVLARARRVSASCLANSVKGIGAVRHQAGPFCSSPPLSPAAASAAAAARTDQPPPQAEGGSQQSAVNRGPHHEFFAC